MTSHTPLYNFFESIFYWLCYYSFPNFSPLAPLFPVLPFPPASPPLSSCPWVVHISSLASPFPILFLAPCPCLFSTYHLCYLFSVPFPPLSPSHSPIENPSCDLHFCGSVPVLVVCLVFVSVVFIFLGSFFYSCEFVVILLFIILIFFFLDKSL